MKWIVASVALTIGILTAPQSIAGMYYMSGNILWENCKSSKDYVAFLYVQGVYDGIERTRELYDLPSLICIPKSATAQQATDIVCKYLRENPEERHYSAPNSVLGALSKAWPCGKKGDRQ